jgi:hypothetical protein
MTDKPVTHRMFVIPNVTDYGAQVEKADQWTRMHQREAVEVHDHRRNEVCNERCIRRG